MAKLGAMQFDIPFPLYYTCSVTVLKRWCITVVYKEMSCLAIHDISGVGKCSLTVALPVLSCCGVETSVMPTAVLSTHTGGFTGFTYRDLTDDLLPMAKHWKQVGCHFQSLYSGFLGSAGQIGLVEEIFDWFREKDTLIMVDPVMGDGGKLYQTYTQEMADGMGRLCRKADIVVPNMTEACHLLEREYDPGPYTREQVEEILHGLCKLGPKMAVLTGVWLKVGSLGTACYDSRTGRMELFLTDRIEGFYHGTGDLFASALLGGLLNGAQLETACEIATEFTWRTIETTFEKSQDHRFGPKFETHLPWLAEKMEACRKSIAN